MFNTKYKRYWYWAGAWLLLVSAGFYYLLSPNTFYWYEEAKQDDGSIVLVKKIASASGLDSGWFGGEPGVNSYGYRFPKVEFEGPKAGETIRWDPFQLYDIAEKIKGKETAYQLFPYALHFHNHVPYMFATFFPSYAYHDWGCPIPPYIVWRWEGDYWQRIRLDEVPVRFRRRNLLPSGYSRVNGLTGRQGRIFEAPGITVTAEQISSWVRSRTWPVEGDEKEYSGPVYKLYKHHIHYEDVGDVENCGRGSNVSIPELENVRMK